MKGVSADSEPRRPVELGSSSVPGEDPDLVCEFRVWFRVALPSSTLRLALFFSLFSCVHGAASGEVFGIIRRDPSVCNSNQLHVDIFRVFLYEFEV